MHHNFKFRNKTSRWAGTDSQDQFEQNSKDPDKLKQLQDLGWTDLGAIWYSYNSHGFRDVEFDDRPCGIAIGCSHTEGLGIPQSAAWPSVLSKLTNTHVWNLGVGGSSIDTCFRLLDYWLPILKPQFVTMCVPPADRVEVIDRGNAASITVNLVGPEYLHSYYKVWASDDANAAISKRKNLLAMQQLCDVANIPLRYIDSNTWLSGAHARDLMHHGVDANAEFAQRMYNLLN